MSEADPIVECLFHDVTKTCCYVVADPATDECVVIDSVADYNAAGARLSYKHADRVIALVEERSWRVKYIIETHIHADHITASMYLKKKLGGQVAIGERVTEVQKLFAGLYNLPDFDCSGAQFDVLAKDGMELKFGGMTIRVISTPGHTPACCSWLIGDAVFTGDTIFMPDFGSARCDFPGGSAATLFASVQKLFALPDATRCFVGHDYMAPGRDVYAWETTIGELKSSNVHLTASTTLEEFRERREKRDSHLDPPGLLLPSLQINMAAGALPDPEDNGQSYLKIPVTVPSV